MRIAIASSGLGHVARGIETWALDTANALAEDGADVTLFAAGPVAASCQVRLLRCSRRSGAASRRLARLMPPPAWRFGLKSPYGWEQWSFWLRLWPALRRGRFDILHVQDPMLAAWCRLWRRMGLIRTREILAHGTEEPAAFLARFERVQHLTPWHLARALDALRPGGTDPAHRAHAPGKPGWTAIPNFVDTSVFRPAPDAAERAACRRAAGVPEPARVIGCVAAVKMSHKRIDWLIREVAAAAAADPALHLLIVGATDPETGAVMEVAREIGGGRVRIVCDVPRAEMPALYRAMDLFVLPSLFEMMPIALLEAMASGLPVVVNRHPVLEWIAGIETGEAEGWCSGGGGGAALEMAGEGALSEWLARGFTPAWAEAAGRRARERAEEAFDKKVIIGRYASMYEAAGRLRC